jgi:hypothetical protein
VGLVRTAGIDHQVEATFPLGDKAALAQTLKTPQDHVSGRHQRRSRNRQDWRPGFYEFQIGTSLAPRLSMNWIDKHN